MNHKIAFLIAAIVLLFRASFSGEPDKKVTMSGFAYYQFGQLVNTSDPAGDLTGLPDKSWDQHANFRLTLDATVQQRLRIIAGAEFGMATFAKGGGGGNQLTAGFSPKEAQGIYTFGNDPSSASPVLQTAIGYFPFKYNPQATNMGEYLFSYRTGSYPAYIINDFDNCKARLLGMRVSSTILGSLKQDLLFTSEMTVGNNGNNPAGDYSLSYLVGYKTKKLINCGAGICFCRLIPLNPTLTTPADNIAYNKDGTPVIENGDTLRLTLRSTKLMARVAFDPKALFPALSFFGDEDLKLYSELAVLGVKNYGIEYSDILKRIPVMIGFNVPTLKELDVLSLEMEYFGYPGNTTISQGTPEPNPTQDAFSMQQMFRWSFFAQKTLTKGILVKALIGKDHFRTVDAGGSVTNEEVLRGRDNWHYVLRCIYQF
jgi:hypothetical protein